MAGAQIDEIDDRDPRRARAGRPALDASARRGGPHLARQCLRPRRAAHRVRRHQGLLRPRRPGRPWPGHLGLPHDERPAARLAQHPRPAALPRRRRAHRPGRRRVRRRDAGARPRQRRPAASGARRDPGHPGHPQHPHAAGVRGVVARADVDTLSDARPRGTAGDAGRTIYQWTADQAGHAPSAWSSSSTPCSRTASPLSACRRSPRGWASRTRASTATSRIATTCSSARSSRPRSRSTGRTPTCRGATCSARSPIRCGRSASAIPATTSSPSHRRSGRRASSTRSRPTSHRLHQQGFTIEDASVAVQIAGNLALTTSVKGTAGSYPLARSERQRTTADRHDWHDRILDIVLDGLGGRVLS